MRAKIKKLYYSGGSEKLPFRTARSRHKRVDPEEAPTRESIHAAHRSGDWPDGPGHSIKHFTRLVQQHANKPFSALLEKLKQRYKSNDLRLVLERAHHEIAPNLASLHPYWCSIYEFYLDEEYVIRRVPDYQSWRHKHKEKVENRNNATSVVLLDGKEVAFFHSEYRFSNYLCRLTDRVPQPIQYADLNHEVFLRMAFDFHGAHKVDKWPGYAYAIKGLTVFDKIGGVWYENEYRLYCYTESSPYTGKYPRIKAIYKKGRQLGKKELKKFNLPR